MKERRTFYDFAVSLKNKYNDIKDLPEDQVSPSLQYIPWILRVTAEVYKKHHKHYDFNELLSVAFTASVEAEKKYDSTRNKFTTYAKYHVEPALNEYVSNMSKNQLDLQKKVLAFIDAYNAEHNVYPSDTDIQQGLSISEETFKNLFVVPDISYLEDDDTNILCTEMSPEESLMFDEYFKALEYIDVDNNGILKMKIIDDLSFVIIAARLGCTKQKAQKRYDKAIQELREELELRGITHEDYV